MFAKTLMDDDRVARHAVAGLGTRSRQVHDQPGFEPAIPVDADPKALDHRRFRRQVAGAPAGLGVGKIEDHAGIAAVHGKGLGVDSGIEAEHHFFAVRTAPVFNFLQLCSLNRGACAKNQEKNGCEPAKHGRKENFHDFDKVEMRLNAAKTL